MVDLVDLETGGADRCNGRVGNVSGLAPSQMRGAGSGHRGEYSKHLKTKFRVGSLNVSSHAEESAKQ